MTNNADDKECLKGLVDSGFQKPQQLSCLKGWCPTNMFIDATAEF